MTSPINDAEMTPEETFDGMEDYDPTCPTDYEDDDDDWWDNPDSDYDDEDD